MHQSPLQCHQEFNPIASTQAAFNFTVEFTTWCTTALINNSIIQVASNNIVDASLHRRMRFNTLEKLFFLEGEEWSGLVVSTETL